MEFLPLLVIGAVMYAVLILPQQRRNREHKALLASLEEGDEVLLNSGIHGFISSLDGNIIWLEVAEKVELKVSRSAVAGKVEVPEDSPTDDTEDS
jgi:preprotein translocase subunit YajC